jgi:hypothetical protein
MSSAHAYFYFETSLFLDCSNLVRGNFWHLALTFAICAFAFADFGRFEESGKSKRDDPRARAVCEF